MSDDKIPQEYDLVLGGNNPPPVDGLVLGGIEGVKTRLASSNIKSQMNALSEAFNYGDAGLNLVIDALTNYKREVRNRVYQLLQQREEKKAKEAVNNYKFWSNFEYLNGLPNSHAKTFARKKVENFNPEVGLNYPFTTAYALRNPSYYWTGEKQESITKQFELLLQEYNVIYLQALIFGFWDYWASNIIINPFLEASEKMPNLQALFIGDIVDEEMMISSIELCDLSPILEAYPNLEILHIRGSQGLRFGSGYLEKHDKLKAIRIESGGLPREAINGLCSLNLPSLEYLELWMGRDEYGGTSTINDLMPIIKGEAFPHLKYLGFRNAEYTDEIVFELIKSPLIKHLIELDLSLGTLGIEGANALINCLDINELDTLNVSHNWLRNFPEIINQLLQLNCNVVIGEQDWYNPNENIEEEERYCSVAE